MPDAITPILAQLRQRVATCQEMLDSGDPELGTAYWQARLHEARVCLYLAEAPDRIAPNECAIVVIREGALTAPEADLVAHALGWPGNYRNFFAASDPAYVTVWEDLARRGLAYERKNVLGPDRLFAVTDSGRAALATFMEQRRAG